MTPPLPALAALIARVDPGADAEAVAADAEVAAAADAVVVAAAGVAAAVAADAEVSRETRQKQI